MARTSAASAFAKHGYDVIVYSGRPLPQLTRLPHAVAVTPVPATFPVTLGCASCRKPIDLENTESTGLHHVQREHILRVLNATHWVIEGNSGAALKLGMKPATLRHRMKKLGISRAQVAPAP